MPFLNRSYKRNEVTEAVTQTKLDEGTSTLEQAEDLLKAADDAIRKALSGNSEEFLQASRQAGGQ